MNKKQLIDELALALECASIRNEAVEIPSPKTGRAWGVPSPFQDKINELLILAGRKPAKDETTN